MVRIRVRDRVIVRVRALALGSGLGGSMVATCVRGENASWLKATLDELKDGWAVEECSALALGLALGLALRLELRIAL